MKTLDKAKYTPGPWSVEGTDQNGQFQVYGHGNLIAVTAHECVMPDEIQEANATLVAAAPELLEALKAFMSLGVGQYKTGFSTTDKEVDAIFDQGAKTLAKAKGH